MNIFTFFFSDKIAAKYTPKRTKLHPLKKIEGACPERRTPLTSAWRSHAQHGVSRHAYIHTFEN